jgi:hypothetical protein
MPCFLIRKSTHLWTPNGLGSLHYRGINKILIKPGVFNYISTAHLAGFRDYQETYTVQRF